VVIIRPGEMVGARAKCGSAAAVVARPERGVSVLGVVGRRQNALVHATRKPNGGYVYMRGNAARDTSLHARGRCGVRFWQRTMKGDTAGATRARHGIPRAAQMRVATRRAVARQERVTRNARVMIVALRAFKRTRVKI